MGDLGATLKSIGGFLSSDLTLLCIGIGLSIVVVIAWVQSNRAEATPGAEQLTEMHRFVNDHFAKYVARGLAAEGLGSVAVSEDPAWRKVYLQHLRLHNELYAYRKDVAMRVFERDVDDAVRREVEAIRAAGRQPSSVVVSH